MRGRPSIDIICGDINMARAGRGESGLWLDSTLNTLESRRLVPVADWSGDCCFIGLRETLVQQLHVTGNCWGAETKHHGRSSGWHRLSSQYLGLSGVPREGGRKARQP